MRLRQQRAPALLLLLPTLRALAATVPTDTEAGAVARAAVPDLEAVSTLAPSSPSLQNKATKDAPVDGLDGKPHEGPWVDDRLPDSKGKLQPAVVEELGPSASRASSTKELTKEEWAALGAEGDGVMDDPNRPAPKGNTGTEGGVSQKDQERKEHEGKTGEKLEQVPQPPKEAPPHPHTGQETLEDTEQGDAETRKLGAQGLEVSTYLLVN